MDRTTTLLGIRSKVGRSLIELFNRLTDHPIKYLSIVLVRVLVYLLLIQVKHRETGEFVCAGHTPGGIFINIGDLLQMWSGDQLVATVS